jgi:hypothetical protein
MRDLNSGMDMSNVRQSPICSFRFRANVLMLQYMGVYTYGSLPDLNAKNIIDTVKQGCP